MSPDLEQRVLAHFAQAYGLDGDAGAHLWRTGRHCLGQGLAALSRSLDAGDAPAAAHWAHSVKGDLLNMGLAELAGLARGIDEHARQGRLDPCAQPLAGLLDALSDCLEADPPADGRSSPRPDSQGEPQPESPADARLSA